MLLLLKAFDLAEERAQLWVELRLLEVDGRWVNEARLHERVRFADTADGEIGHEGGLRRDTCILEEAVVACDTRWCTMKVLD